MEGFVENFAEIRTQIFMLVGSDPKFTGLGGNAEDTKASVQIARPAPVLSGGGLKNGADRLCAKQEQ